MSRKQHKIAKAKEKQTPAVQWAVIAAVVVLVGVALALKAYHRSDAGAAAPDAGDRAPTAVDTPALAGSAPSLVETAAPPAQPTPALLPEAQLDQLLAAGEPVFVFFHSNNCVQCVRMIEIVEQVYPDFSATVALVDVNVYDENNRNLLSRAGIRAIPTLIFIDRSGQGQGYVGVMEAARLREQLEALAGE